MDIINYVRELNTNIPKQVLDVSGVPVFVILYSIIVFGLFGLYYSSGDAIKSKIGKILVYGYIYGSGIYLIVSTLTGSSYLDLYLFSAYYLISFLLAAYITLFSPYAKNGIEIKK